MFFDVYCEVNVNWLEFFFDRICQDCIIVFVLVIDIISLMDFFYLGILVEVIGGFSWDMQFNWYLLF